MQKVTAAVITRSDGRILLARRRRSDRFGGLWEFPGGKLEGDEEPRDGLRRELLEELGVAADIGRFLGRFPYAGPELAIELLAFRAALGDDDPLPLDHDELAWAEPADLPAFPLTEPDKPLAALLAGKEPA